MDKKEILTEEDINSLKEIVDIGLDLADLERNKGWLEIRDSALQKLEELDDIINTSEKSEDILMCVYIKRGVNMIFNLYNEMLNEAEDAKKELESSL